MGLSGKVICFTGALNTMKRAEASQKAIAAGATVAGTVTKKVNVLVVGGGGDNTNKSWEGTGVEHWTEAEFIKHLGGSKKVAPTKAAPAPSAKKAAPAAPAKKASSTSSSLNGKVICFTGTLESMKRAEATQKAIAAGATVANTVTSKVELLIVGGNGSFTNKATHEVVQWTEAQFLKALGGSSSAPAAKTPAPPPKKAAPAPAPAKKASSASSSLNGKVICFTGTLYSMKRAEATQKAKDAGATVAGSVTSKVSILVVGAGGDQTNKNADSYGVEQWSEADFLKALGSGPKARKAPGKTKQDDEADGAPAAKKTAKK